MVSDETEARIRAMFEALDQDGDGRLTKEELSKGLVALGLPTSKRVLEKFMKTVDLNEDGFVEREEFFAITRLQASRLKKAFEQIDVANRGEITAADLHTFAQRMGMSLSHDEVKKLMMALDKRKTGRIDLAAFVEVVLTTVGTVDAEEAAAGATSHAFAAGLFERLIKEAPLSSIAVPDHLRTPSWVTLAAGFIAGIVSRSLTAPADRVKVLLQASETATTASAAAAGPMGTAAKTAAATTTTTTVDPRSLTEAPRPAAAAAFPVSSSSPSPFPKGRPSGGGFLSVMSQHSRPVVFAAASSSASSSASTSVSAFLPSAPTSMQAGSPAIGHGWGLMTTITRSSGAALGAGAAYYDPLHRRSAFPRQPNSSTGAHLHLGLMPDWEDVPARGQGGQQRQHGAAPATPTLRHITQQHHPRPAAGSFAAAAFPAASAVPAHQIRSVRDAISAIIADGGVKAFWRGNGVNVLKVAPETAARFLIFEELKRVKWLVEDADNTSLQERFLCGALAGSLAQTLIYPLETAKTRIALSTGARYRSIGHCLASVANNEGFPALYRGLGASLCGIIPYSGVDLALFSLFKDAFHRNWPSSEPGIGTLFLCGACSTTVAQMVSYPLQLVRTRLQASSRYKGILDCAVSTVQREGVKGLYRGMGVNFLKAVPSMALSWVCYESAKKQLMEKVVSKRQQQQL